MDTIVYTTDGGRRFHTDAACRVFTNGRDLFGWLCSGDGPVYQVDSRSPLHAALLDYTACRVCVPTALALPTAGETYGHEPVTETDVWGTPVPVCARCAWLTPRWLPRSRRHTVPVPWPCTSALVLGLAPRGGA